MLEGENKSLAPTQFEVLLIRDLAGKFSGSRTFVELLEEAVPHFYEQVGERLRGYVAPPPKLRRVETDAESPLDPEGAEPTRPDPVDVPRVSG